MHICFYDISKNNQQDGETCVVLNADNCVYISSWFGGIIDHGSGTPIEKAFRFNVTRVDFTNEKVDAHPKNPKFGREQWQLVKVYGTNP